MDYRNINEQYLQSALDLYCSSFFEDDYFKKLFPDPQARESKMRGEFAEPILFCLKSGKNIGVFEDQKLIAFIMTIDLDVLRQDSKMYEKMFATGVVDETFEEKAALQKMLAPIREKTLYCLSIAVKEEYRGLGLASLLIDLFLEQYEEYTLIADVSNQKSLNMYRKRDFSITPITDGYFFVFHPAGKAVPSPFWASDIRIAVASDAVFRELEISPRYRKDAFVKDIDVLNDRLVSKGGCISLLKVFDVSYSELLQYQKRIGLSVFKEKRTADFIYYISKRSEDLPSIDEEYRSFLQSRLTESTLCPDVFVSIPVRYSEGFDWDNVAPQEADDIAEIVLKNLDFRTQYEAGIISSKHNSYGNPPFKNRIKRRYLGKIKVCCCDENTLDDDSDYKLLGPAYYIDMYISYDEGSHCAVLGLFSLSCPFVLSFFFDNIVRNQIVVIEENSINLYDFLEEKYQIIKSGAPKIFSVIPDKRESIPPEQIGSLLSGEMIYSDGESFGQLIDSEIMDIVHSPAGMGQYNRGCVLVYRNVILQFDERLIGGLEDRVAEEIITQFYIELVMFEEASIHATTDAINDLFGAKEDPSPVKYLKAVEAIQDNYSKTMCFWNITLNYPTSQKSVEMIRNAFRIDQMLEKMQRNKAQLEELFDTKNDIIDRLEAKRVDTALTALSLLAIFSALIDCFDFIGAWQTFIPEKVILSLQLLFSVLILSVGVYVIIRLLNKRLMKKAKKERRK